MLNSSIELDVILLEQFEEFFGIFQNEWTGIGKPVWIFYWWVWLLQYCGYGTGVAIVAQWELTTTW